MMNANNLHVFVMSQAIMAEVEAMKALNASREDQGLAQAYGEESFREAAWRLENLAHSIDFTSPS